MTLINYVARIHFAEQAIEDALPEEIGRSGVGHVLLWADESDAARQVAERVRLALPQLTFSEPADCGGEVPRAVTAILAIGGAGAIGAARRSAGTVRRAGRRLLLITIPIEFSDLGLARFAHDAPRPDLVIADPTALDQVDGASLARSGMETLVHAVEAFANPGYHPPADALALDAVRRLAIWLPGAVRPRLDREARREALAGALNAGLGMEKGVGGVDAVAHRLERRVAGDGRGGLLHAPLMAALVPFNMPAVGERYGALAGAMGAASGGAAALAERLRALAAAVGLPATLGDGGADRSWFDALAEAAADDPAATANPRRLSARDYHGVLEAAW